MGVVRKRPDLARRVKVAASMLGTPVSKVMNRLIEPGLPAVESEARLRYQDLMKPKPERPRTAG